jgi:hypothetical protein
MSEYFEKLAAAERLQAELAALREEAHKDRLVEVAELVERAGGLGLSNPMILGAIVTALEASDKEKNRLEALGSDRFPARSGRGRKPKSEASGADQSKASSGASDAKSGSAEAASSSSAAVAA